MKSKHENDDRVRRFLCLWCFLCLLSAVFADKTAWSESDPWDPESEVPPPPGSNSELGMPPVFDGTLSIDILTDSVTGKPALQIIDDPKSSVPVTYMVQTMDTAVLVTIRVLGPGERPNVASNWQLPDSDFVITVVYPDSPKEKAIFRVSNDAGRWLLSTIQDTGFAKAYAEKSIKRRRDRR